MARNWVLARSGLDRAQPGALEHARQHDPHLGQREARAQAAPGAAPERDPGVGVGSVVAEEALGPELLRLRVQVGAAVDRADRGVDLDAGRNLVAVERERLLAHHAPDAGDHRADAQRLLDHGVQVAVLALAGQGVDARVVQDQVKRPGQAGGGGLVAGQQQRQQLVADLAVGEGLGRPRRGRPAGPRTRRRAGRDRASGAGGRSPRTGSRRPRACAASNCRAARLGSRRRRTTADSRIMPREPRQRLDHRPQTAAELGLLGAGLVAEHRRAGSPPESATACLASRVNGCADRPGVDLQVGAGRASSRRGPASAGRETAGSISLRWRRCSAPSSSSTDRSPRIGPSRALASPACS